MNEEDGRELDDREAFQASDGTGVQRGDGEIDFAVLEPSLEAGLKSIAKRELQLRVFQAQALDDGGQVVAEDEFGGGDAEEWRLCAAETRGDGVGLIEKRASEFEQLAASGGEAERLSLEEFGVEVFFEAKDLTADGGLLDAVGHVANGSTDAAMFRDVVEQLDVMEVHRV